MSITKKVLGCTKNGETVTLYTMRNKNGVEASVTDLGAVWTGLRAPDREGRFEDVLLGYDTPDALYETNWLAPLGFHNASFLSADYFPLLPWAFVFAAGTFIGRWAARGQFPKWMYPSRVPPLSWMGRHALILYIVHQPVIIGVCTAIEWIMGA